jgi:two-component system, OmpR family, phosphate regulon sensor histidine kinase PhoR
MNPLLFAVLVLGPGVGAFRAVWLSGGGAANAWMAAIGACGVGGTLGGIAVQTYLRHIREVAEWARRPLGDRQKLPVLPGGPALQDVSVALQERADRLEQRAREKAGESRALAAALDGMAEGLWITDAEGTVLRHNRALEKLVGTDALEGRRPLDIVRSPELHDAVARACHEGKTEQLELSLERPTRTLLVRVSPLGRELPGSAAMFHDLTELRRLEAVRTDFVANVSHELRTPITAIRGYAETLQAGALQQPDQASRMVEIIHRQSVRIAELVDDLLELSRLESKEAPLARSEIALNEAAHRALEAVRQRAEVKGIRLSEKIPESLIAVADARALEQVVLNLLDNAIKYTAAGGSVEVQGQALDGRCALSVRDTGFGIEPKHLPRIFERFYRIDKGRSRDMGGTGLGLAIVKHLVSGMDGEMRVESQPGVGSTFTVLLPSAGRQTHATE